MKNFRVFLLIAFAFVLPLTLWGLSPSPGFSAQNSVSNTPTDNVVSSAAFDAVPFMAANYEQSANPINFGFLRNGLSEINHSLYNSRTRTVLSNSDSWRTKQTNFVKPIYKPNIPNAGYQSKNLTNLNKSSPLRR